MSLTVDVGLMLKFRTDRQYKQRTAMPTLNSRSDTVVQLETNNSDCYYVLFILFVCKAYINRTTHNGQTIYRRSNQTNSNQAIHE